MDRFTVHEAGGRSRGRLGLERQLEIAAESDGCDDAVARLFGKPPRYELSDEDGTVDLNNPVPNRCRANRFLN